MKTSLVLRMKNGGVAVILALSVASLATACSGPPENGSSTETAGVNDSGVLDGSTPDSPPSAGDAGDGGGEAGDANTGARVTFTLDGETITTLAQSAELTRDTTTQGPFGRFTDLLVPLKRFGATSWNYSNVPTALRLTRTQSSSAPAVNGKFSCTEVGTSGGQWVLYIQETANHQNALLSTDPSATNCTAEVERSDPGWRGSMKGTLRAPNIDPLPFTLSWDIPTAVP